MSEFVVVDGYQRADVWQTREHGPGYPTCGEVVTHPRAATAPCILLIGHEGAHEALFIERYREVAAT